MIRRNITSKDDSLFVLLYKAIVRPHLEYCIQAWSPYLRKDIDMFAKYRGVQLNIPGLKNHRYEERLMECDKTRNAKIKAGSSRRVEVFKILNGYENIDSNIFFSKLRK